MRMMLPDRVDYLVVGAGATGMAFCDTLLHHHHLEMDPDLYSASTSTTTTGPSVVLIDDHARPGGQWHDSYDFVRLHQPSEMYGVESTRLEERYVVDDDDGEEEEEEEERHHRATKAEILDYYDGVCGMLESKFDFHFVGETSMIDLDGLDDDDDDDFDDAHITTTTTTVATTNDDEEGADHHRRYGLSDGRSILARKVVDARYLRPDLPSLVHPRFLFDPKYVRCFPVNALAGRIDDDDDDDDGGGGGARRARHYVVIGAGKTGMDAMIHLVRDIGVDTNDVVWIVPNEAWITARENIGGCMEFLHECTSLLKRDHHLDENGARDILRSTEFFQNGFLEWEKQGKVYRFDEDIVPTKFKDATLCKGELDILRRVTRVVRKGRIESIDDKGTMHFNDGTSMPLPWSSADTVFVHCSAGAFNYSERTKKPPPVFSRHRISIQDVYGTPGFCFVGSIIGKLEGLGRLTDAEKNSMCSAPSPDAAQAVLPLGPSGGDIGVISKDHGYVQRLSNLRKWLQVPEIRSWLVGHRLFNLGQNTAEDMDTLVEETWNVLEEYDVVSH